MHASHCMPLDYIMIRCLGIRCASNMDLALLAHSPLLLPCFKQLRMEVITSLPIWQSALLRPMAFCSFLWLHAVRR